MASPSPQGVSTGLQHVGPPSVTLLGRWGPRIPWLLVTAMLVSLFVVAGVLLLARPR